MGIHFISRSFRLYRSSDERAEDTGKGSAEHSDTKDVNRICKPKDGRVTAFGSE